MRRLIPCLLSLSLAACAVSDARQPETETISIDAHEGTELAFDLAPNDSTIVFDLLGQLWTLPASGGAAHAITDAVRDTAEDLDPAISPDGRSAVFRAERHGRTGLWLIDLATRNVRQLTQVANPDEYEGDATWSPDGRTIAFTHLGPDSTNARWYSRVQLLDVASGAIRDVTVDRTPRLQMRAPAWTADGKRIAFVAAFPANPRGGRAWIVDAGGGRPSPLSPDSTMAVLAASFSPDGKRVALLAGDSLDRPQVWTQQLGEYGPVAPTRLTAHAHVASTRVRWTHDGSAILYAADGKLRRMDAPGGSPTTIEFNAHLRVTRPARRLPSAKLIDTSGHVPARAFLGLALSPDGKRIGAIALGKLWIIPVGGSPRAVADAPFTARGLSWSPDGKEVAWSAGPFGEEDLFAADVTTGATKRITALPGREAVPSYSPDGRSIAFTHQKGEQPGALRIIDAHVTSAVTDTLRTRKVGPGAVDWTRRVDMYPQWSPSSDALLVVAGSQGPTPPSAKLIRLSGSTDTIKPFIDNPIFLQWNTTGALTFVRHDRLWRVAFDGHAVAEQPRPLGDDAALYASASNDGSILYISSDGLRLRLPSGAVRRIGWPITYTPPVAPPLVIRNARIVDGKGTTATAPSDILIERGRIALIAAGGTIKSSAKMIDAAGKFVMPGLMDLHAHTYRNDLLPASLYFGVTTVRDQGSSMGPLVAYAAGISAGVTPGPRIAYGGFQFYSDWGLDEEQGRGIEPEADSGHVKRSVGLAQAFGAQHIKTRTFRRWDINARMIAEAHRRGMRATGHCAMQLPLIAAGMDAKEHLGFCSTRGAASPYALNDMMLYDDQIQLLRAAGVSVVPTIVYLTLANRLSQNPKLLDADSEVAPFISKDDFSNMPGTDTASRALVERAAREAHATLSKLVRAGVTVGTGTDVWQLPTAVHIELQEFVAAGLTPAEAIRAATSSAARIIGVSNDLGSVEPGKWADLVIVDADPLADIRNTRRISAVLRGGRIVDRAAIRASFVRP